MTVWKFPLTVADEQIIDIPRVNQPLTVQVQDRDANLWVLVDPDSPRIRVRVRIFGTGHPGITRDMLYVGTFQMYGGNLVWHVFLAGVVA